MIFLDDKVKVENIRETIRSMRKLDKEAVKALRNELKGALLPTAKSIASKVPTQAPLSGFNHNGRTRWTGARAGVSFTPGTIRRGQDVHPLVSIRLTGKGGGAGFDLAEIAGSRNLRFTRDRSKQFSRRGSSRPIRTSQNGQGRALVRNLKSRAPWSFSAGRFGFGYFLKEKKSMEKISQKIINSHQKEMTRRIARGR